MTAEAFAPFGVLPPDEGDGHPTADLEFLLDDGWVNYIGHTLDEIEVRRRRVPLRAAQPARHAHADADADERRHGDRGRTRRGRLLDAAHFDTVAAFLLPQHTCVHLHRGTWHWGPYPVGAAALRIFNIQGRGYPNDNTVVRFAQDLGLAYDVQRAV